MGWEEDDRGYGQPGRQRHPPHVDEVNGESQEEEEEEAIVRKCSVDVLTYISVRTPSTLGFVVELGQTKPQPQTQPQSVRSTNYSLPT